MIYQDLTFEQRLHNAIGAQEIEQVKAWHAYTHGMGYSKEEWDAIWYRGEDVTWAHFFGRMVGWDQVWFGSVINPEEGYYERYCNHILNYPGASYFDARSVGCTALHCLASGVIEVAEDGKSGRSCYLTPGTMMARMSPNKVRNGGFLWERTSPMTKPTASGTTSMSRCARISVPNMAPSTGDRECTMKKSIQDRTLVLHRRRKRRKHPLPAVRDRAAPPAATVL